MITMYWPTVYTCFLNCILYQQQIFIYISYSTAASLHLSKILNFTLKQNLDINKYYRYY